MTYHDPCHLCQAQKIYGATAVGFEVGPRCHAHRAPRVNLVLRQCWDLQSYPAGDVSALAFAKARQYRANGRFCCCNGKPGMPSTTGEWCKGQWRKIQSSASGKPSGRSLPCRGKDSPKIPRAKTLVRQPTAARDRSPPASAADTNS
jgi:hypothetical protein